jgi:iron(III) transport system substrate-binding protein
VHRITKIEIDVRDSGAATAAWKAVQRRWKMTRGESLFLKASINYGVRSTALIALLFSVLAAGISSASAQGNWQAEWGQRQEAARKEGKVVVSIPPSAELRKALEAAMKQKFGIQLEIVLGSSNKINKRAADEYKAGVRYFDIITSTWDNLDYTLLPMGAVEPLENYWILPEVKDPKNWFGGHVWTDKAKRYAYSPYAYMLDNIWYNTSQVKESEIRAYDDLLNPKWKGKIAMWDPREGGAAAGKWAYLWQTKGEGYLKKLADQVSLISTDRRLVADALARAKVSITIGPTFYSFVSYVKAGLPVKPFPPFKEGTYVSMGNGGPVAIKNPPHPNAARVLVNWMLSREGQDIYSRAHGQATRRNDVETKWMDEIGVRPAKDYLNVDELLKYENQSEDKILTVRRPAQEIADKLFK